MAEPSYTTDSFEKEQAFERRMNRGAMKGRTRHSSESSFRIKCLQVLLVIILFALILEAVYYFIVLPLTAKAKFVFDLQGTSLSEAEAVAMLGLRGDERWGTLDSSELAASLNSYPLVEAAFVSKKFPDKVMVRLLERHPVAVSFVNVGGKLLPLEIDKDGVVFRMGWQPKTSLLTIVSGLNFKNPKLGMKVNYQLLSLFKRLDFLMREKPVLLTSISEIKIREKKYGDYDLILYPTYKKVKVLTNKELTEKALNRMLLTLDVLSDEDTVERKIEYIDIRGANIVYKWAGD